MFLAQEKQGLLEHLVATYGTTLLRALAPKLKTSSQAHERGFSRGWEQVYYRLYLVLHLYKQFLLQYVMFLFYLGTELFNLLCDFVWIQNSLPVPIC